jgi:serine/threonine-protein kinase
MPSSPRPSPVAPRVIEPDEIVAGKYRIQRLLGEGGMGSVFEAHHELLDVRVAVKVLSSDFAQNPKVIERFMREARAVARLKSEHVARVMDIGLLDDRQPFIVMEILEGSDLERLLASYGQFGIERAVDCVLQALEAMAHAHAAGIVHRDLKPANLFMTRLPDGRDTLKVLDFGIAKLSEHDDASDGPKVGSITGDVILGSPSYMSPEQVRNPRSVDARTDIWSLGTILYELLTGRVAFGGLSAPEIFAAVIESTPPLVRTYRPQIPAELESAVAWCLQRDPAARPANVSALARAIVSYGSGRWSALVPRIEQTLARGPHSSSVSSMKAVNPTAQTVESSPDELEEPQRLSVLDGELVLGAAVVPASTQTRDKTRVPPAAPSKAPAPPPPLPLPVAPTSPDAPEADELLSIPPPPAGSPGDDAPVVLVVDDDAEIRALVIGALASQYTVYEAADGEGALDLLRKIPNPDAMVCDVAMPRMDGFALGKRMKADPQLRTVPILFLLEKSGALDVIEAINSGARHHMPKPFKVNQLLERLTQIVAKRTA